MHTAALLTSRQVLWIPGVALHHRHHRGGRAREVVVSAVSDGDGRVYVGKGKWLKDDVSKYPSRTTLTGGWAGGEVGMWQFREAEQNGLQPRASPRSMSGGGGAAGEEGPDSHNETNISEASVASGDITLDSVKDHIVAQSVEMSAAETVTGNR